MFSKEFKGFIKINNLFSATDKVLLAVSGGADSMTLLHLFLRYYQNNLTSVLHCNFSLRGSESDSEEAFLADFCKKNNIQFYVKHFSTQSFASKNGVSTQMAARDLRYTWFEEMRLKLNANYIAVGTHKNDEAETLFINLIRGTGIKGLKSILPKRNSIIRPLLFALRSDIERYATETKIEYKQDSSNNDNKYWRNKIRNEIIPKLEEIREDAVSKISDSMQRINQVNNLYSDILLDIKNKYINASGNIVRIDLDLFKEKHAHLYLHDILSDYSFNSSQIKQIIGSVNTVGAHFKSSSYELVVERSFLEVSAFTNECDEKSLFLNEGITELVISPHFTLKQSVINISSFSKELHSPNRAILDKSKLHYPLKIRKWQAGDRFVPFGMKGYRKVSDFLNGLKLTTREKKDVYVILSEKEIVWVVGFRISNSFKVVDNSNEIVKLSI